MNFLKLHKINKQFVSVIIYGLSILFILTYPMTAMNNVFLALLTLLVSILFLNKVKKNVGLFIIGLFIAYVNYSIFIGEFLFFDTLTTPFVALKTPNNYGIAIKSMLIFIWTLFCFLNEIKTLTLVFKFDLSIFIISVLVLIYILIFGINRVSLENYEVAITPLYEYSKLIFIVGFIFTGDKKFLKLILSFVAILFMIQDVYYGGRITTIQIGIIVALMMFYEKINYKHILLFFIVGIFGLEIINVYRYQFDPSQINIEIFETILSKYFIFDTATFAYYSSISHIEVAHMLSSSERFFWFLQFLLSMIELNTQNIDISVFISNQYYLNYGGGLITSWFYFWLGYLGVIGISLFVVYVITLTLDRINLFSTMIILLIVSTSPRWYLYSPNHLIRGIFLMILFYGIVSVYFKHIRKKDEKNQ